MGNISSTNKSPYGYLADLLQQNLAKFTKDIKNLKGVKLVVGRTMKRADHRPMFYVLPNRTIIKKQTGIGLQKTLLKNMDVTVMYYTDDLGEDLFVIEQFITQIYVVNNQLVETKQYKNINQEFMQIGDFDYGYVYDAEAHLEMKHISTNIRVAYQDSYYGVT